MALNRNDMDRDPGLDRVYALGEREEPPARLDDAIRAAARREVGARPALQGKTRRAWYVPVSLAAVLVLSVTLVTLMREEGADRFDVPPPAAVPPPDVSEKTPPHALRSEPAPAPKGAPAARGITPPPLAAAIPETDVRRERAATEVRDDRSRQVESVLSRAQTSRTPSGATVEEGQLAAPSRPTTPPVQAQEKAAVSKEVNQGPAAAGTMSDRAAPFAMSPAARSAVPADPVARRAEPGLGSGASPEFAAGSPSQEAQPKVVPPPAKPMVVPPTVKPASPPTEVGTGALASRARVWAGFEPQPPEKWIERIEELRRTGREAEAREMLEEFKKRFPEHRLPAGLAR